MKTKQILLTSCMLFAYSARAQLQTPLSLISTSGSINTATISGKSQTVEWTIGEAIISAGGSGNLFMTIGEQQQYGHWPTRIDESALAAIRVYPNPSSDQVQIDHMPDGTKEIRINDLTGKMILSRISSVGTETLPVGNLSAGTYTLIITNSLKQAIAYKININH